MERLSKNLFNIENFEIIKKVSDDILSTNFLAKKIDTGNLFYAQVGRHYDYDIISRIRYICDLLQKSYPSIQNIVGFSLDDFSHTNSPVVFSNDIPKYELRQMINLERTSRSPLNWTQTRKYIIIYGIASGMSYLHSQHIIHNNLNPSSVYLDENYNPKISGFIFRHSSSETANYSSPDMTYLQYIAPEILEGDLYSYSADVYSFSMLIYYILTASLPFENWSAKYILREYRPIINSNIISDKFKELIESCWSEDPEKRPKFDEIVDILSNPEFISESNGIDIDEFNEYVDFLNTNSKPKRHKRKKEEEKIKFTPISLKIKPLNLSRFKLIEHIGFGISGDVYKAIQSKTKEICAAKIYSSQICEETRNSKESVNFLRELEILSNISHPSVLKLIGCSPINFENECKPILITELLINNSLEKVLEIEREHKKVPKWDGTRKFIFIYGIAYAILYLHKNKILHRDIKPENILIDDYFYPKICDFGFSKSISQTDQYSNEIIGTPSFISPEIYSDCKYSEASDVYAYSMLLYELFEQKMPFQGLNATQIMYKLCFSDQRPELTNKTPKKYKELINACWNKNPLKRPTFEQIVSNLKTDSNFKFDNFDQKLFDEYIQFIEQKEIKKLPQEKIILESLYLKYKNHLLNKEGDGFIAIDNYEKSNEILNDDDSNYHEIIDKKTGQKYSARISNISIENYSKQEMKNISKEVKILSEVDHPTIQKFHGFSYVNFAHNPNPVIISEYLPKQRLFDILEKERKGECIDGWNDTKKLINIYGIALGMSYLHSKNIIHYNLNPKSIFIDNKIHPKIADFGFYTNIENSKNSKSVSFNGFKELNIYFAPEVINAQEKTKSSDIYSFSLIVYEIITKKVPFKNANNLNQLISEMRSKNNGIHLDKSIPHSYRKLIKKCSDHDPNNRPSFAEIVDFLKSEKEFITKSIKKDEYLQYIDACG